MCMKSVLDFEATKSQEMPTSDLWCLGMCIQVWNMQDIKAKKTMAWWYQILIQTRLNYFGCFWITMLMKYIQRMFCFLKIVANTWLCFLKATTGWASFAMLHLVLLLVSAFCRKRNSVNMVKTCFSEDQQLFLFFLIRSVTVLNSSNPHRNMQHASNWLCLLTFSEQLKQIFGYELWPIAGARTLAESPRKMSRCGVQGLPTLCSIFKFARGHRKVLSILQLKQIIAAVYMLLKACFLCIGKVVGVGNCTGTTKMGREPRWHLGRLSFAFAP